MNREIKQSSAPWRRRCISVDHHKGRKGDEVMMRTCWSKPMNSNILFHSFRLEKGQRRSFSRGHPPLNGQRKESKEAALIGSSLHLGCTPVNNEEPLADHFNFLPPSYLLFFFAATGRQFLDFFLLLADRLDYLSEILSRRTSPSI